MKHHPLLLRGGSAFWCHCSCGWRSGLHRTVVGAHLAFGRHLVSGAA